MSRRIRRTPGKSSSSIPVLPEANVATLRKKLTDREEQKDAEIHASWQDKPKKLPSPSDSEEYLLQMAIVNRTTAWLSAEVYNKHFKNDESPMTRPKTNEEEIQVLEPPPKVHSLCIDLDLDDKPAPNQKSTSDLKESTSDFVERELHAQLSAASMPAVSHIPDVVRVPQVLLVPPLVSETTTICQVPCPVPLISKNISFPIVTHSTQLSHQPSLPLKESSTSSTSTAPSVNSPDFNAEIDQAGTSNHFSESGERSALQLLKDRIIFIDRTIEELHFERKALTEQIISLKYQQFDLQRSVMSTNQFPSDGAPWPSELITATLKTPPGTESTQLVEEASPLQPFPPAASTEFLDVMHQLEENEVPVANVDTAKRKRISDENEDNIAEPKAVDPKFGNPKVADGSYSRRGEFDTQKATQIPSEKTETSQGKDTAAGRTAAVKSSVSKKRAIASPANAKQPLFITNQDATKHMSMTSAVLLEPHSLAVKCVYICGPCAFTASEDGTINAYDLKTNSLLQKLDFKHVATWMFGIAMRTSNEILEKIKSTTEYIKHITLVTGSKDAHIREFALERGEWKWTEPTFCNHAVTCAVGRIDSGELYVGTTDGSILSYTLSNKKASKKVLTMKFKVEGEVISMNLALVYGRSAIIIAAKQKDPIVFELNTGKILFKLASKTPSSSIFCISISPEYVFCCDANKNISRFDKKSGTMYQTGTLISAAVASFFYKKRFLLLGCLDGVIRVIDTISEPPYPMFTLQGLCLKNLTCMKVLGDTIVGGSLNGEVLYCKLPNLEALSKASEKASL